MHLKRPLINQRASRDHEVWGELGRGEGSGYRAGAPAAGRWRTRSGGRRTAPWGRTMTTRRRMMMTRRRRRRGWQRGSVGRRRGVGAASGVTQPLGAASVTVPCTAALVASPVSGCGLLRPTASPTATGGDEEGRELGWARKMLANFSVELAIFPPSLDG